MRNVIISLGFILVIAFTSGCTPEEVKQLEGIIQNVDTIKGEITVVTKDGETVKLDVDTGASVEAEGTSSNLETLEVGASIQIEISEDNQVVQSIKAQQAEIEGKIVQITDDEVTVETEDGERVTIVVSEDTRIDTEDTSSGTSRSLQVGEKIATRYDPESKEAFTVSEQEEEGEVEEGTVTEGETETDAEAITGEETETDGATVIEEGTEEGTVSEEEPVTDEGTATEGEVDKTPRTISEGGDLAIVMGNVVAMEGVMWTIEQGGVLWVVDMGVVDLPGNLDDWDVGDKITIETTWYDGTYIVDKAWLYPADDPVDDPADEHHDDHSDDGRDDDGGDGDGGDDGSHSD
ncbi:hypothetical protein ACFLUJ_01490 [Chloroflexota bacterium]